MQILCLYMYLLRKSVSLPLCVCWLEVAVGSRQLWPTTSSMQGPHPENTRPHYLFAVNHTACYPDDVNNVQRTDKYWYLLVYLTEHCRQIYGKM